MSRQLWWNPYHNRYFETRVPGFEPLYRDIGCIECTGDLEDEKAATQQFTGEDDEDE